MFKYGSLIVRAAATVYFILLCKINNMYNSV